jgi:hypothetical protein
LSIRAILNIHVISLRDWRPVAPNDFLGLYSIETCADSDEVFLDPPLSRIYVSCGEGSVEIFKAEAARYRKDDKRATIAGARTALFVAARSVLLVGSSQLTNSCGCLAIQTLLTTKSSTESSIIDNTRILVIS